jgi:mono/diheme cytochrome c family protein
MNAAMKTQILILLCVLIVSPVALGSEGESANGAPASALYRVKDGNKVDARALAGWKTWRALACERCHGAEQEGLVGPALVESMKKLTKQEFRTTIMEGRLEKGMPPFSSSRMVNENWEGLYAYLKGRADGRILPGRLSLLEDK